MARRIDQTWARGAALAVLGAMAFGFPADAAAIDGGITIDARASQAVVATDKPHRIYLRIAISGPRPVSREVRAPLNVALVIDRSGSMSGARIENARRAAMLAVERLGARDIVSVVSYDDRIEVEVPATRAVDQTYIKDRIRRLTPRGSTAIYGGMQAGAAEARKFRSREHVNRIILLSDGLANVGPSRPEDFARLGGQLAGEGITVSTIGLGTGYNEDLMSRLARAADGNHVFVQEPADLAQFFDREFDDVLSVIATDLEITIDVLAGARPVRSLGREAQVSGTRLAYKVGQLVGGAEQALIAEIELPAGVQASAIDVARVRLAYRTPGEGRLYERETAVAVRGSPLAAEVEGSYDKEVMRDASLLSAREDKDEAIRLRDAGRYDEAQKKFDLTARQLMGAAERYKFDGDAQVQAEAEANRAAATIAPASAPEWQKQRKILREKDNNQAGASTRY